jgi:hypothetical protein
MMESSLKAKKFALPRFYVRQNQAITNDTSNDIMDELLPNDYILNVDKAEASTSIQIDDMEETQVGVEAEVEAEVEIEQESEDTETETITPSKAGKATKATKTAGKKRGERAPSAYNIFIKNTCERLVTTHGNLTAKERYALAIRMWNEQKQVVPTTS